MNSKETWDLLEKLETKDIKVLISSAIIYLENERKIDFKNIIKDIKNCRKYVKNK